MAKQINFKRHPIITIASFLGLLYLLTLTLKIYNRGEAEHPMHIFFGAFFTLIALTLFILSLLYPYYAIVKGRYLYVYEAFFSKPIKVNIFNYDQARLTSKDELILIDANQQEIVLKVDSLPENNQKKLLRVIKKLIKIKKSSQ